MVIADLYAPSAKAIARGDAIAVAITTAIDAASTFAFAAVERTRLAYGEYYLNGNSALQRLLVRQTWSMRKRLPISA